MLNPNLYTNDAIPTSEVQHRLNKVCALREVLASNAQAAELRDRIIIEKLIDGLDAQIVDLTTLTNKL